jgi:glycosyltransferase involved in cell wall biosynthesis
MSNGHTKTAKKEPCILILNHEYPPVPGGAAVLTRDIVVETAKRRKVVVISSSCPGAPRQEELGNIEIYRVPCFGRRTAALYPTPWSLAVYTLFALPRVYAAAKRHDIVLIHSFAVIAGGVVGHISSLLFGIPHFCTIIGADIYSPVERGWLYRNRFYQFMVRRILTHARHVISISSDIAGRCQAIYGFKKPITVIPPPLNPEFCSLSAVETLEENDGEFRVCSISRLVKRKSLETILEAVSLLNDQSVHYYVVGTGDQQDRLLEIAKHLGIEKQVHFEGRVDHVLSFVKKRRPHLFVLVSHHEGFGVAYLEAMACGLPVIAGDQGGQTDFVINGENGYIVPVGDIGALAERIRFLKEHPAMCLQLAAKAYAKAQEFHPSKIAGQYQKIYEDYL